MSTVREKLPEILIEGLFVVFAILLALAADEWREGRQNSEIAERAMDGIQTEINQNREELRSSRDSNLVLLDRLQAEVSDGEPATDLSVQFEYSTLSDAAWQTAQVTRAIQYSDYDLVQQIARLYDIQELFIESQRSLVDEMAGMLGDPDDFARVMLGQLGITMSIETGYMAVLDTMIVVMENR